MTRAAWPIRLAAREGRETARAGRWTSLLVVVAIAWTCAVPGAMDAKGVTRLVEDERAWIDAGGQVFVVTGAPTKSGQHPIPAHACDALSGIEGIQASFALLPTNGVGGLTYIPGGRSSIYGVTPGAYEFLDATHSAGGNVFASSGFARRTGVANGEVVRITQREGFSAASITSDPLTVDVVDASALGDQFDGALLVPTVAGSTAGACYVRTDTAHYTAVRGALDGWLADEGEPAIVDTRLFSGDFTVDFTHAYQERPLRWVWIPAAAILGLLWGMIQWFRRSHVAIYATFGARPHSRLIMQASEWGLLATTGGLWGWSIGVVASIAQGARASQAFSLVSLHTGLTLLGASVLVVLLGLRPTGTLLSALKDH